MRYLDPAGHLRFFDVLLELVQPLGVGRDGCIELLQRAPVATPREQSRIVDLAVQMVQREFLA